MDVQDLITGIRYTISSDVSIIGKTGTRRTTYSAVPTDVYAVIEGAERRLFVDVQDGDFGPTIWLSTTDDGLAPFLFVRASEEVLNGHRL